MCADCTETAASRPLLETMLKSGNLRSNSWFPWWAVFIAFLPLMCILLAVLVFPSRMRELQQLGSREVAVLFHLQALAILLALPWLGGAKDYMVPSFLEGGRFVSACLVGLFVIKPTLGLLIPESNDFYLSACFKNATFYFNVIVR